MNVLGRIFNYLKRYKGQIVLLVVLAAVVAVLSAVQLPVIVQLFGMFIGEDGSTDWLGEKFPTLNTYVIEPLEKLIESIPDTYRIKVLAMTMGVLIALSFLKCLAAFLQEYTAGKIHTSVSRGLAADMYEHVVDLSMSFYNRVGTSSVVARFTNDIEAMGRGLKTLFGKMLVQPFKLVGYLFLAMYADWQLFLINAALFPIVAVGIYHFGRKSKRAMRKGLQSRTGLVNIVQETSEGMAIVKAFNMEEREKERFREENAKTRRQDLKLAKVEAATGPMVEFIGVLGVGISFLIAAYKVLQHPEIASDVMLCYGALIAMTDPLRKLGNVNNRMQMLIAAGTRVFAFMDMKTEVVERPGAVPVEGFKSEIEFEGVSFTYNGTDEVLRGVDLKIRKGEIAALVGPSGAGKSTIARLIPRFYDVTEGAVKIDGRDVRDFTLSSVRAQIGLVTQEVILFDDTIAANIAYGRPGASAEEIEAAARAANAHDFIAALPKGYDSGIGEKGLMLSGGQRQRIALARAIIKDPPILILDEATSSLDSESEHLIQKALDEFMKDRTSIVIAHRLSTVQKADRIFVISEGRLAASGKSEELLESSEIYKRLYNRQFQTS